MREWKSVKEKLPENCQHVLVFSRGFGVQVSFYANLPNLGYVGFNVSNGKYASPANLSITHWMPLPEPPKEES